MGSMVSYIFAGRQPVEPDPVDSSVIDSSPMSKANTSSQCSSDCKCPHCPFRERYYRVVRVGILGDPGTGKGSLALRFASDLYCDNPDLQTPTFGFFIRTFDEQKVKFRFAEIPCREYYNDALFRNWDAIIVTYDITRKETFEHVSRWLSLIDSHSPKNPTIVLVGTKSDLADKREVPFYKANDFVLPQFHIETSAKARVNVDRAFELAATARNA